MIENLFSVLSYVLLGIFVYFVYLITIYLTASLICEAINRSKIKFFREIIKASSLHSYNPKKKENSEILKNLISDAGNKKEHLN